VSEKKFKIHIQPGAFDNWDGTQEELDEFMEEITRQIESGEFFKNSVPLDSEDEILEAELFLDEVQVIDSDEDLDDEDDDFPRNTRH
jgi:hypothetical protein